MTPLPTEGWKRDKAAQMYRDNKSYTEITRETGLTGPTIKKIAREAGLPDRRRPGQRKDPPDPIQFQTPSQATPSPPTPPAPEVTPPKDPAPESAPVEKTPNVPVRSAVPTLPGSRAIRDLTPEPIPMPKNKAPEPATPDDQEWECDSCGALMEGDKPTVCLNPACGVPFE